MKNLPTIEYEKTYLPKYLPEDLEKAPFKEYLDIYIPKATEHPRLRIRKRGDEYEITKKFPVNRGDSSEQNEFTIPITKDEFTELEGNLRGKRSRKLRYFYKFEGNIAEIDVYQDKLLGLIIVDFEFESNEKKSQFKQPDFCLADVTEEKYLAGGRIVGKTYQEMLPILKKYSYKPLFL